MHPKKDLLEEPDRVQRRSSTRHPSLLVCPVCQKVLHKAKVSITEINLHINRCSELQFSFDVPVAKPSKDMYAISAAYSLADKKTEQVHVNCDRPKFISTPPHGYGKKASRGKQEQKQLRHNTKTNQSYRRKRAESFKCFRRHSVKRTVQSIILQNDEKTQPN
uniref:Uncharacterized protein n=1 Tax=Trieres chinensis TaxID=1514140 RepID=A0A7S1ZF25_TRICV|mmetsp:Transcript_24101/g.48799  ORF Transcript_24101/g.48799 Transcript_24101/m.48799 type:complete len:163 (+) Transcript_24101:109-597(+)